MAADILIVDDEPETVRVLATLLMLQGYSVRKAFRARQALEQISQQLPDLLLLDVMMPDIDGISLLRRLRSVPQTRDLPVVLVSARSSPEAVQAGMAAGATGYITKPFNRTELYDRIARALGAAGAKP
jgi:CheY-like chemotaxis protein